MIIRKNENAEETSPEYAAIVEEARKLTDSDAAISFLEKKGITVDQPIMDFIRRISPYLRPVDMDEYKQCTAVARRDDGYESSPEAVENAKRFLYEEAFRLPIYIAAIHAGEGMPFIDMVLAGNEGLWRATRKYGSADRKFDFSEYAAWFVEQTVIRAIRDACFPKAPLYILEDFHKLSRCRRLIRDTSGTDPTPEELSLHTGFSADKVRRMLQIIDNPPPED